MKATGIVRRIDDLGRVVIPKEIRRTQRIREGDPLEIFTTGAGEVIFKKYSPMGELAGFAAQYAEVLNKALNLTALVCDRDSIIAAAGGSRRDYQERGVSIPLERIMDRRKPFWHSGKAEECVFPCEGSDKHILGACPLLAGGDVAGAVLLLSADKSARPASRSGPHCRSRRPFWQSRWRPEAPVFRLPRPFGAAGAFVLPCPSRGSMADCEQSMKLLKFLRTPLTAV